MQKHAHMTQNNLSIWTNGLEFYFLVYSPANLQLFLDQFLLRLLQSSPS